MVVMFSGPSQSERRNGNHLWLAELWTTYQICISSSTYSAESLTGKQLFHKKCIPWQKLNTGVVNRTSLLTFNYCPPKVGSLPLAPTEILINVAASRVTYLRDLPTSISNAWIVLQEFQISTLRIFFFFPFSPPLNILSIFFPDPRHYKAFGVCLTLTTTRNTLKSIL